jgi:Zn-dependent peptidase ImmA (M78 family)/transcriptional regulator with XRE-family HTH domain
VERDVGARIRRIREAAGVRGQELATQVGIDPTVLSKIENGRRAVKSSDLTRIAEALHVSPLALLEDNPVLSSLPVAARRNSPGAATGEVYKRLLGLSELHVVLADAGIPTSPMLAQVRDVSGLGWYDSATALAEWALKAVPIPSHASGDLRLSAIADSIEQYLKVDVLIEPYRGDPLSGAAITHDSFPLVFVNSAHPHPRSLFTLAHELGHVLARHQGDTITLDDDLTSTSDSERIANAFAASYLMPADVIRSELGERGRTFAALMRLTYRLGVSYQSLIYRLHNLSYVNAVGRDKLLAISWQQISSHLDDLRVGSGLSRTEIAKLQSRSVSRPARRAPALLLGRALQGFRKGIVSVRPLADLMDEDDPDALLERLSDDDGYEAAVGVLESKLPDAAPTDSKEDLFAGSPI